MKCPRCGKEGTGNFCAACGASLKPSVCPSCGAKPEGGDRFCNTCGTFLEAARPSGAAVGGGAAPTSRMGWWAAGALLVIVILLASRSVLEQGQPGPDAARPASGPSGAAVGQSAVDLSTMTPREAADRLFNRVMRAVSSGDSAEVQSFLPMAVASYERVAPLDADGTFHLALLKLTGLDFAGARATAEAGLSEAPEHLLLLSAAAEAAVREGDSEAAAEYYRRLLDGWDGQLALELEEYEVHSTMLPDMESEARSFLEGR
jgi:hypothetical protein